jgi:hypothetical protein
MYLRVFVYVGVRMCVCDRVLACVVVCLYVWLCDISQPWNCRPTWSQTHTVIYSH